MSNEVTTKEKVYMDPKYIIKLTVTLLLTCMVVAGLLGWDNSITKDKIAAITWEKTVAAMQKVIEADDFSDAMELTDDMTAAAAAQASVRTSSPQFSRIVLPICAPHALSRPSCEIFEFISI